jgi:hypothetical protein
MPAPSVTSVLKQGLKYFYGELQFRDFSGGLNVRDAASQLGQNESPADSNVTLDERGGVAKRLGYVKYNTNAFNGSLANNGYYWPTGQNLITQCGTELFKDTAGASFKTFTTTSRCAMVDFTGLLFIIHPIDGLFSYDGATVTALVGGPKGSCIANWQGKLWASADPSNKSRVYFSDAGNGVKWYAAQTTTVGSHTLPTTPITVVSTTGFTASGNISVGGQTVAYTSLTPTTFAGCTGGAGVIATGSLVFQGAQNFNDIREKDTEPVVALSGASGLDVSGRPGLLAFKQRSTYRIYDSTTGAYQTLDAQIGAASANAVTNGFQRTVAIGEAGIFWTDGVGPMRPASDKLQPLFNPSQIAYDKLDLFCAGFKGDRMYFSLARAGSTANDLMLEYHPLQGWIVANTNAASFYATYGKNDQKLYTGHPTTVGRVYEQLNGGSDDGAAIVSYWQSRWIEPTAGHPVRIVRARINGRGAANINMLRDYETSTFESLAFNLATTTGVLYDAPGSVYDTSLYATASAYQATQDFPQPGVVTAIAVQIAETSTSVQTGLSIIGGAAPTVGAWGIYGIDFSYVPLGLS